MRARYTYSIAVLLVILFLFASLPLITGILFKKSFYKMLAIVSADTHLKINVVDYRQGWFTSSAKIYIEQPTTDISAQFKSEMLPMTLGGVTMDETITHGPLIHDPMVGWTLAYANIQSQVRHDALARLLGPNVFVMLNTRVGFGGNYYNQLQLAPVTANLWRYKLNWQGFTGSFDFKMANQHIQQIKSDAILGALVIDGPKLVVKTSPLTSTANMKRQSSGLWEGMRDFSLPSFSLMTDDNERFDIMDLRALAKANSAPNDAYNLQLKVDMKNITTTDIQLSPLSIDFSLNALDGNVLMQLMNTSPNNVEQYNALLPHLFTRATLANWNMNVSSASGRFIMNGEARWPEGLPPGVDAYTKTNYKLNLRMSITMLNELLAWMDKKQAEDYAKTPFSPTVSATPEETNTTVMPADFAAMIAQRKMTTEAATQLSSLQKLNISPVVYASAVDSMVTRKQIAPEASAQLKAAYQASTKPDVAVITPAKKEDAPIKESQIIRQQIENNIKKGFIQEQNGDYVMLIVGEQGKTKVNGIEVDPVKELTQPSTNVVPMMPPAPPAVPVSPSLPH